MSNDPKTLMAHIPMTAKGNLACPFCGQVKLSRIQPRADSKVFWIHCDTCGATGPNMKPDISWNMRAFGESVFARPDDFKKLKRAGILIEKP
jgi:predicted RNA-binding Zn-ribbon protein involved in translation (DUF1610 family)